MDDTLLGESQRLRDEARSMRQEAQRARDAARAMRERSRHDALATPLPSRPAAPSPGANARPPQATKHAVSTVADVRVGDRVSLPSGLVFKVTFAGDPARPWGAVRVGKGWVIRRQRALGGLVTFYGGRVTPLKLEQADAEAVAAILNRVKDA